MVTEQTAGIVGRIVKRDKSRPEAQLQAEVYSLLTSGGLQLGEGEVAKLEVPTGDGTRRRLDVEVGHCCIEIKKDLRVGNVLPDATTQLAGYVRTQASKFGSRYTGIITDGVTWHLYRLTQDDDLAEVVAFTARPDSPDELIVWLESVLATDQQLAPTPENIRERLGASSPAHQLDHATLLGLYDEYGLKSQVQVKKDLWSKLLRTAFGSAFEDNPSLFVDHTLLVITAEAIAHGVVGFDLAGGGLTPREITRGDKFHDAQIYGVVEEDFFDWVLDVPGGAEFVSELARRIARFNWASGITHDVLKALYTSVIPSKVRQDLGEYYTPDWLANRMVADAYNDPANQRLLEPACGSGTFLLHAVTAHLDAREAAGTSQGEAVSSVTRHVTGMDVHPVAVILARVTYLMAIGRQRLQAEDRGELTIPVYLGDSLQWEQRTDLLDELAGVTVSTHGDDLVAGGGGALFGDDLRFPAAVLTDASNFDTLVSIMADKAVTETRPPQDVMMPVLRGRGIHDPADQAMLIETFDIMRRLHNTGKNHIWGYYVRNLIRPIWLAKPENKVDVLIGNPPWLRYSKMTTAMQERYKDMCHQRSLLGSRAGASSRDLSTLFVTRTTELYLKVGGKFAFVMPHGTLSRRPHENFRSGKWSPEGIAEVTAALSNAWDLDKVTTTFPMSSCVIRGSRAMQPTTLPSQVTQWTARLPNPDADWATVKDHIMTSAGTVSALSKDLEQSGSPYRSAFRQGAILVPRLALFVVPQSTANPLGTGAGRIAVESYRSNQENEPYKSMDSLSGTVERRFVRETYLGETVAPYRLLEPRQAVLPISKTAILTQAQIDEASGLSRWWGDAERVWANGRKPNEKLPLLERFDYHDQLSAQLPAATHRVLYTKAGTNLAAARLNDPDAVIDHNLYWAAAGSENEALYLVAILNSETLLARVQPLQARGLYGPRHFDKYVFTIGFPLYDAHNEHHTQIAQIARRAEDLAAKVDIAAARSFQAKRKLILKALDSNGLAAELEDAVEQVLPNS